MEISVLGHVKVRYKANEISFKKSKVGQLVALLAVRAGEIVSTDTIVEELWGRDVPRSVSTTLQTYIYHARRTFHEMGCVNAKELLLTQPPGYTLNLPAAALDAHAFAHLVEAGAHDNGTRCDQQDVDRLAHALALWRGPAFGGIPTGPVLDAYATYLYELRLATITRRLEVRRHLGQHRELIPELRSLVSENPLNENFHTLLIGSLSECGRRAEAVQAYRQLWRILDSELGVRPQAEVEKLYSELVA